MIRSQLLALAVLGGTAGCFPLPQPPPVLAPDGHVMAAGTWGIVAAPLRVVASREGLPPLTLTTKLDGVPGLPLFDPRTSVAAMVGHGWGIGGHVSVLTAGLELRKQTSNDPRRLVAATLGAQFDGPLRWGYERGVAWEVRAGATFQPTLGDHLQFMLGAGASVGPRRHRVVLGELPQPFEGPGAGVDLKLLRSEVRAEGLVGVMLRVPWTSRGWLGLMVAAQPYVVAHAGKVREAACSGCGDSVVVDSISAPYGVAVTLSLVAGGARRP